MKNKPLELDNELNKTNGESGERIPVSGNCSINGGRYDTEGRSVEGHSGKARVE